MALLTQLIDYSDNCKKKMVVQVFLNVRFKYANEA